MVRHVTSPSVVKAAGNLPKIIEEFVGRVNTDDSALSIARMTSPPGWIEPGQTPEFDEYTLVLAGSLLVETRDGTVEIKPSEAVLAARGEWVRYSTPAGAEYVAICVPAFSPETVHRDSGSET